MMGSETDIQPAGYTTPELLSVNLCIVMISICDGPVTLYVVESQDLILTLQSVPYKSFMLM